MKYTCAWSVLTFFWDQRKKSDKVRMKTK